MDDTAVAAGIREDPEEIRHPAISALQLQSPVLSLEVVEAGVELYRHGLERVRDPSVDDRILGTLVALPVPVVLGAGPLGDHGNFEAHVDLGVQPIPKPASQRNLPGITECTRSRVGPAAHDEADDRRDSCDLYVPS